MLAKFKKIDWIIIFIMVLFMGLSTTVIYSATLNKFNGLELRNIAMYVLGFIVLFGAAMFDYRLLLKGSIYLYAAGVISLIAVYKYGAVINNARGWFKLPFDQTFQPAELMKIILIIAIGQFIAKREGRHLELGKDVVPMVVLVFIPFTLVLIQPDLGNAIIYLVIVLGMFWIGNIKYTQVLIGTAAIVIFLGLFYYVFQTYHDNIYNYLASMDKEHWVQRIDTFLNPESVSKDEAYQVNNSIRAIGSGGLSGEGYMNGSSVQKGFIPYAYSDDIFVVVGEEFGFLGSSVLLLLYFVLIYRLILISLESTELGGSFIVIGIVSMFVFQIFQNIGMHIGLMPLTGITLPFVSYGGTSLMINMVSIGIIMSIKVHQEEPSKY